MNTLIIGVSGKKQAGKNSVCEELMGFFNSLSDCPSAKIYSFADMLKQKVCIDVMGLTHEQCYGTDEQKNAPTSYKWEQLPHQIRYDNKLGVRRASNGEICEHILPKGFMTSREIMQIVGTDIFRKYFDDSIWVNATFRNILKENPAVALISDVRFPSEVIGVVKNYGYVIRLLRNVCGVDPHSSETALDDYNWLQHGPHACVIDNRDMSKDRQFYEALQYLKSVHAFSSF